MGGGGEAIPNGGQGWKYTSPSSSTRATGTPELCPVSFLTQAGFPSEMSPATHSLHGPIPSDTFFTDEN